VKPNHLGPIRLSCRVFFSSASRAGMSSVQLLFEVGRSLRGPGEVTVAVHLFKWKAASTAARAPKLLTDPFKVWAACSKP